MTSVRPLCLCKKRRLPSRSGIVGEDHLCRCLADWFGVARFWYKPVRLVESGMPWVIAIAMAETEGPGDVFYAVNYSPAFADPLGSFPSAAGDISTTGIESFLRQKLLGNPPDFWRRLVSGDVLHRLNRDRRSFERRDRGLLPRGNGGGDV